MATTTAAPSKRPARRRTTGAPGLLQQREAELAAMVARQAATLEILKTMSASPDDPQPVFEVIARRAGELCKADTFAVLEYDGALVHLRALGGFNIAQAGIYARHFPMALTREMTFGSAIIDGKILHTTDYAKHIADNVTDPRLRASAQQISPTVV